MPTSPVPLTLIIIMGHTITAGFYLAAQVQIAPYLPAPLIGFGLITMIIVPLIAAVLVYKNRYAVGVALLVSSLVSAAILGPSCFILSDTTPFGVQSWTPIIHPTAYLLLLFEGVGCWVSWRLL